MVIKNFRSNKTHNNKIIGKLIAIYFTIILLSAFIPILFFTSNGSAADGVDSAADYLKDSYKISVPSDSKETTTTDTKTTDTGSTDTGSTDTDSTGTKTITKSDNSIDINLIDDNVNEYEIDDGNKSSENIILNNLDNDEKVSPEGNQIVIVKEIGDVSIGETIKVSSDKNDKISIDKVEFITSKNCNNVKFTVEKLDDKPEEINEEPLKDGIIYEYLDIKLTSNDTYLHEEEFESMKFEFKVNKTWINEKNINENTVTLVRYHDEWQYLNTYLINEDENHLYYTADSSGLSTYTIVGTQIVEAAPSLVAEKTLIPITGWIAIIAFISVALSQLFTN